MKEAEEQPRKHESQQWRDRLLTSVLETTNDGFWVVDDSGRLVEANRAYCEMTGFSRTDLIGKGIAELEAVESKADVQARMRRIKDRGYDLFESVHRRVDGTEFPVEVSVTYVDEADGLFVCFCRDLSQRRAEEQHATLLAQMLDDAPVSIVVLDDAGRLLYTNEANVRWHGYTDRQHMLSATMLDLDTAESAAHFEERCTLTRTRGEARFEVEHRRLDGSSFPMSVTSKRVLWRGQDAFLSIGVNLTAEKRAQATLLEQKHRLDAIIDGTGAGTWEWNVQTGQVVFNEAWARMLGYSLDELEPISIETWMRLAHPEDLEQSEGLLEAHFRGESDRYECEARMRHANGGWIWVADRGRVASWTPDGRPEWMFGTHLDITERKRTESALKRRAEFERLVSEVSSTLAGARIDELDDRINGALAAIGEFSNADRAYVFRFLDSRKTRIVNSHEWCAEGIDPQIERLRDVALREELPWFTDRLFEREVFEIADVGSLPEEAKLERIHFEAQGIRSLIAVPMLLGDEDYGFMGFDAVRAAHRWDDDDRQLLQLVGNTVTEALTRRSAEGQKLLLERQVQHAQKLESLGVLAGGIAHDFNNILTGILGRSELAMSELDEGHPAARQVRAVVAGAKRATDLTHQMLAYAGKGPFVVERVDVSTLISDMSELLRTIVPRNIELELDIPASLPTVRCDVAQLQQVVMNLLTNAAEAIGNDHGSVSVSAGTEVCCAESLRENPARVASDADLAPGACVFIEVRDTGCGMDSETRDRLFEPFFTTKFTGRGLGMAAVLGIVRSHNGAILLDSEPGSGTTIRVLLPTDGKRQTKSADGDSPDAGPAVTPQPSTVLVVDDEEPVRELARAILDRVGVTVLVAEDGQEGLEQYRAHQDDIDCVLLDLTMPRLSGQACLSGLRAVCENVKVIVMSGYSEDHARELFADAPPTAFISKPFAVADFKATVLGVLNRGNAE